MSLQTIIIGWSFCVIQNNQGRGKCTPANFFWDISVRFLSWQFWDFCRRHNHFRRFPKKSEVFRRSPQSFEDVRSLSKTSEVCRRRPKSAEGEVTEKTLIHKITDREEGIVIYSFTHGFRSLHGSELTYFWKYLCQARGQQLTFFNQVWETGLQAWAGMRSKFSTRRRESWQVYKCYQLSRRLRLVTLTKAFIITDITKNRI